MQGPRLDHPTERCSLSWKAWPPTAALSWPWANWILAHPEQIWAPQVPSLPFEHPCRAPVHTSRPLPAWQGCREGCSGHVQLPLGFSSKENTDCLSSPFDNRGTETSLLFLLPENCGETWISNAPKYLTQELVSNPDLVQTGTALCPQLPVSRICVVLRDAQQGSEAPAADLSDFYEL